MSKNRINIGLLLGDPSGIGPELISKLLAENITEKANIVVIGEKNILDSGRFRASEKFSKHLKLTEREKRFYEGSGEFR